MEYGTIQKVVYPNAGTLVKRREYMETKLRERGVPDDKILRHEGRDAADYKSRFDVAKAAADDGFPEIMRLARGGYYDKEGGKGDAAWAWTTRRTLRQMSHLGTCIFMNDDEQLVKHFSEYEVLVRRAGEFDIIQLMNHGWHPDNYHENVVSKLPTPTVCSFDNRFQYGMPLYGEHVNIYSSEGARKTLELLRHVHTSLESMPAHISHGIFRCISLREVSREWCRGARGIQEERFSHRLAMNDQERENWLTYEEWGAQCL